MFHGREEKYLDVKVTKKSKNVLKNYVEELQKTISGKTSNNMTLFPFVVIFFSLQN